MPALAFFLLSPAQQSCLKPAVRLLLPPLVRELILHLADQGPSYPSEGKMARLASVLLEQIPDAPVEALYLPVSTHPKIKHITDALFATPGDRTTLRQWAVRLATSERSLARLVQSETGVSFGRWRQQLHLVIALRHLAEGQSVQNVAGTLGYDSVSAFITMFKKALGKSPTQYFASFR